MEIETSYGSRLFFFFFVVIRLVNFGLYNLKILCFIILFKLDN